MKKNFGLIMFLVIAFVLVGCGRSENRAPAISGNVENDTMILGDSFNVILGVHASDLEDGDITDSVVVSVSPNITVVDGVMTPTETGVFAITYSVTDSDGVETKEVGKLTVTKVLFGLSSNGSVEYTMLENGQYMDSIGIAGTWTYTNSVFTMTTSSGSEMVGSFNADTNALEVSIQSGWFPVTYSVDESTWQTALGTDGSFVPPVYE